LITLQSVHYKRQSPGQRVNGQGDHVT